MRGVLALAMLAAWPAAAQDAGYAIQAPTLLLADVPADIEATLPAGDAGRIVLRAGGLEYEAMTSEGGALFPAVRVQRGQGRLELLADGRVVDRADVRVLPGFASVLPPLLAIALALALKQVIPALFLGLWLGSSLIVGLGARGMLSGLLDTFAVYVLGAVTDPNQAQIVLFSFMIGGTVGIVIRNGGMQGVVNVIVGFATNPKRGQLTAGALGVVIFFDDYANTLVVGNTMRQVTDRLRISREKLAYIVDSTAAPVSCVALVTTWIGYEVGLIGDSVALIDGVTESAYSIFLNSIAFSFYPFLTMFLVFTLAGTGRDYGPMLAAETRARTTGQVLGPDANVDDAAAGKVAELQIHEDRPIRALNAVIPIGVLVLGVLVGLYSTGSGDSLRDIVASADSYKALMWGSLVGMVTAVVLTLAQRILSAEEIVDAWYAGLKSMLYAMIILILAWSLSSVATGLHTADYLVSILGDALNPALLPSVVFVLAALTAFATGSSWATMGILMPLVVPLVWAVLTANDATDQMHILYSTVSTVLAGAVMGDHCSPISDTTILSSMASGSDHIAHVRTQLPYAMTVGVVAVLLGSLPTGFGLPWWISMILGAVTLLAVARYVGKPVPESA